MNRVAVTFLGTRGTVPVDGAQFSIFGGATVSVLISIGGQQIIMDAGTGILTLLEHLPKEAKELHLFISHPHVDHLMGLPACDLFFSKDIKTDVYAYPHGGIGPRQQLEKLMFPPLWPVSSKIFEDKMNFHELKDSFNIGPVKVSHMSLSHPGGCTAFRLEHEGKSIVFATDVELEDGYDPLAEFAFGCDLLMCDGQYSQQELGKLRGFGHSSWEQALELAKMAEAKRLCIIHHAPGRTDEQLFEAERNTRKSFENSFFAKKGECIYI